MVITYTRTLTQEEAIIAAGLIRDENAARQAQDKDAAPITLDEYARLVFDPAVESWLKSQVRKQTMARAADVDARPLAQQLHVLAVVDATLAEFDKP